MLPGGRERIKHCSIYECMIYGNDHTLLYTINPLMTSCLFEANIQYIPSSNPFSYSSSLSELRFSQGQLIAGLFQCHRVAVAVSLSS